MSRGAGGGIIIRMARAEVGLAVRRTWAVAVLTAALGTAGCGPKVYRLTVAACTSDAAYKESLARMEEQPNMPRYRIRTGETGVYAVSRYQLARLRNFSQPGVKVRQLGSREEELREKERMGFSFSVPEGGQVRLSVALSSRACCGGIAFEETSVAVEEAGSKVEVVFDCDLPLARMVLVEIRPAGGSGQWTWVVLDAYRLEDSGAARPPQAGR